MANISKIRLNSTNYDIVDTLARNEVLNPDSTIIVVGKNGEQYSTINAAINKAIELGVSNDNPVSVIIKSGVYEEQIQLSDIHGLSFVGLGKCVVEFNGNYPQCVVNALGDISFYNLEIHQLNVSTYAVHVDPSNSDIEGSVKFIGCYIHGGATAIGYGSGKNTELYVKNCRLSGSQTIMYCHNSSYNKSGQKLTVLNNEFIHTTETLLLLLDDAGWSNNHTVSEMSVIFNGNVYLNNVYGSILFRKDVSLAGVKYLPKDDTNIQCGPSNYNNDGIYGLNYHEGIYEIDTYVVMPSVPDTGYYTVSIPVTVNAAVFNAELISVMVPGVGDLAGQFAVASRGDKVVTITTSNSAVSGKPVKVTLKLTYAY